MLVFCVDKAAIWIEHFSNCSWCYMWKSFAS